MARMYFTDRYLDAIIDADHDTTIALPNPTLSGGGPLAIGATFTVADNLGVAGSHNIAITGPVAGGASGTSISTNYGSAAFRWVGNTFVQK